MYTLSFCDILQKTQIALCLFPPSFSSITHLPLSLSSSIQSFDILYLLPPTFSTHQVSSFHCFITLFLHLGNSSPTSLFCLFLSSFFPPFSHCSGLEQAATEQSSSSPGQSKQNQSRIPQTQFAVTS